MIYNYTIVGAGKMGEAIAYHLLQSKDTKEVLLRDVNLGQAQQTAKKLADERVIPLGAPPGVRDLESSHVVFGAASYNLNLALTKKAMSARTNFVDLGGNNTVVEEQFKLDQKAKDEKVIVIPDCGIAPGAVSLITALGIEELGELPDYVRIRVGGLPQSPRGLLNYMKVFSVEGLINEYNEPTEILQKGKRTLVESLTGLEELYFDIPGLGHSTRLEAAYTSGGSSTLTNTFAGKIKELDYKTIRFPGHFEKMHLLKRMGFFDGDTRKPTEEQITQLIDYPGRDMLLVRVSLGNRNKLLQYELVDFDDGVHSAMQRTTGFSAAIIGQMIARKQIIEPGVLIQENSIPPKLFFNEWAKCGLELKVLEYPTKTK
ncbi:MAG: saccharopine dehydrogenase C-terminal domain-containing protein [Nanoarchaeota archaeon]